MRRKKRTVIFKGPMEKDRSSHHNHATTHHSKRLQLAITHTDNKRIFSSFMLQSRVIEGRGVESMSTVNIRPAFLGRTSHCECDVRPLRIVPVHLPLKAAILPNHNLRIKNDGGVIHWHQCDYCAV